MFYTTKYAFSISDLTLLFGPRNAIFLKAPNDFQLGCSTVKDLSCWTVSDKENPPAFFESILHFWTHRQLSIAQCESGSIGRKGIFSCNNRACLCPLQTLGKNNIFNLLDWAWGKRTQDKEGRKSKKKLFCFSGTDVRSGPSQAARLQEQACERLIRCQSRRAHSESLSKVKMDWSDGPWQQQKGRKWFALFHQEHKHPALMQPLSFPLSYHCTLVSSGSRDLIYHSEWLNISENLPPMLHKINSSFLAAEI